MTLRLARALHTPEDALASIRWGALLHDSGKCGVPDAILLKGRALSEKERASLRKHPEYAYDLFCCTDALQAAIEIPYCHHERWDGTGYPRGLKGADIPLAARIFAVVDAWDILTSAPPCGKGWTRAFSRQQILAQAGKRFDPEVVKAFDALLMPEDMEEDAASEISAAEAGHTAHIDHRHSHRLAHFSMSSRGAKLHFISAFMLISIIPALAFFYLAMRGFVGSPIGWAMLVPLAATVALLMTLGYGILAKYPASVIRLRHWAEGLAKGDMLLRIELPSDEDDLAAIERCLHQAVRQSQQRIHTLERQTEALLVAERQRVAIEGLGAACHHLGQPATRIFMALHMIRLANTSPQITPLLDQCQQATESMAEILQKLQHIAKYRTEPYLVSAEGSLAEDNQLLNGTGNGVQAYVACQAAVSAHAYAPGTTNWIPHFGTNSTPDDYAIYPPTGVNYFNGITSGGNEANFFNVHDFALRWWVTDQRWKPDIGYSYWQTNYWEGSTQLHYTNDTYKIFAFCVQSHSLAMGATPGVLSSSADLSTVWTGDSFGKGIYSEKCWHSGEFYFSTVEQSGWWATLKSKLGL